MRLNWNNLGKGLEGIADAKKARDLAQASARYDVTEGAYGPGLQENIQQLEGLRAGVADPAQNSYDPQQLAAYDQGIAELTRRQGLTAPDFSVASGPQSYGTRQEARQAAAPMRAEGLAGVYRQYGDVAQADALEARAFDQQRALAREQRDIKAFDTQQAAAAQQGLLTGAKLTEVQRSQNLQAALDARLADINKQEFEKPEMRTQAILGLVEELQGPQAAAQLRANYTQQELNDISLQSKKFEEGYRQSRAKGVFSAMEWFDEQNAAFKLERDPKNPFRVIQVNQDGSRQLFADAKNERELGMIVDAKAKPGGWLELAKYDLDVKKADAAIAKDQALAERYARDGETEKGLTKKVSEMEAILGRKMTAAEKETVLGLISRPRDEKPVKVEEAGVQYKMGDKLMQTDGRGGLISAKGVLPDDRPAALKAAGVSDNDVSRLMWSDDGDAVMFNNEEFDIRDKRDMKKLKEALEDYDVMNRKIAEEARLRSNPTSPSGFQGARTTGLGPASSFGVAPGATSIYGR